ncbi:putative diguanylate cyclase YdaM [Vibrio aerogenes CECT 7868]|uniref:Putative diguanylate cyclase YdaM n=1 Tax=Vibrio aerogenes CECT 7868 TaxID=1216006 RepID=A0A1M5UZA7_9VIBR|nr:sensor domain-containing diguanylate cyclase [Vibrio aerogenes]SHH68332.1 putative diguanylate cyclase YdaM [Vibrio aerogenes CECT 7868]
MMSPTFLKSYRKYISYFLLFGLVIAVVSSFASYFYFYNFSEKLVEQRIKFQFERAESASRFFIEDTKRKISSLSESQVAEQYATSPINQYLLKLEDSMLNIVRSSSNIYQLRYLDEYGDEIVKIEKIQRLDAEVSIKKTETRDLQNKYKRYYFQKTKGMHRGDYYISHLDLNNENGRIEVPYKPTLRVSTPVFDTKKNTFKGIVIANMDASYMLRILTKSSELDLYLADKEGFILSASEPDLNWSRYTRSGYTIRSELGQKYEHIRQNGDPSIQMFDMSGIFNNGEGLKLVAKPSEKLYSTLARDAIQSSFFTLLVVMLVAIPLGAYISYTPSKNAFELQRITKTNQLYANIIDQHVPIVDTDLEGYITRCNDAICTLSGYKRRELIGKHSSIFQTDEAQPKDFSVMWRELNDGRSWKGEFHNKSKSGQSFWVSSYIIPKYNDDGEKIGYISVSTDITDKKNLERYSEKDTLTGLFNRSKINRILDIEQQRTQRYSIPFTLLLIDVDHFKAINDNYGHLIGDEVLKEVSNLFRFNIRQTDYVGRWGGEEFIVVCPQTEIEEGKYVAEKLCTLIAQFDFEKVGQVTVSIGVSVFESGSGLSQVLDSADQNLYEAKESGRNRVVSDVDKYKVLHFPGHDQT